jgi:hypothetical protein
MEGNDRDFHWNTSRLRWLRKTQKAPATVVAVSTEIRNEYLPHTSLQRYRYANLLLSSYLFYSESR